MLALSFIGKAHIQWFCKTPTLKWNAAIHIQMVVTHWMNNAFIYIFHNIFNIHVSMGIKL